MKRFNRELCAGAAGAAVAFLMVACGATPMTSTGCTSDAECGTGKMCHPTLKQCITSCTGSSDCPSSAKTCATYAGAAYKAGGAAAFCQCSTDALCGSGQICQLSATKTCTAKCATSSDCGSGATCNSTTGVCTGSATVTDAGSGTADAGSTTADAGCSTTNVQPDFCGYGNACFDDHSCGAIVEGACSNVTNAVAKSNHTAWTSASTGPVIFNVVKETAVQADCANAADGGVPGAFTLSVYAYAGSTAFPATKTNLPGFFYLNGSGEKIDIPANLLKSSNYTVLDANNKSMKATFTLCGAVGATSIQAAFTFTNGNAACATLTK